jgi:copper chaperone CopZ
MLMGNWKARLFIVVLAVLLAPGVRSVFADCGKDHGKPCEGAACKEKGAGCAHGCDKAGCEHGCDKAECEKGAPCAKDAAAGKAAGCEKGHASGACEATSAATTKPAPGEAVYVLGIEGMSCPEACPPHVKESIESIDGVRSVEVNFADKKAVVHTDANVELTTAEVDKSFHNQGYFVSSLEKIPGK